MSKRDPNLVVHGGIYYRLSSKQIQVFRVCGPKRDNGRVTSETETRRDDIERAGSGTPARTRSRFCPPPCRFYLRGSFPYLGVRVPVLEVRRDTRAQSSCDALSTGFGPQEAQNKC